MTHQLFLAIIAIVLTIEQAFDVVSTNLVISKGRGVEGGQFWGLMRNWQAFAGKWWWTIKLPIVALITYAAYIDANLRWAIALPITSRVVELPILDVAFVGAVALYAWVLVNNYRIAWRRK